MSFLFRKCTQVLSLLFPDISIFFLSIFLLPSQFSLKDFYHPSSYLFQSLFLSSSWFTPINLNESGGERRWRTTFKHQEILFFSPWHSFLPLHVHLLFHLLTFREFRSLGKKRKQVSKLIEEGSRKRKKSGQDGDWEEASPTYQRRSSVFVCTFYSPLVPLIRVSWTANWVKRNQEGEKGWKCFHVCFQSLLLYRNSFHCSFPGLPFTFSACRSIERTCFP